MQDLEHTEGGGRVVTISDLKEVLKAKTGGKGQTQRRRGEVLSWGERLLLGTSCQTTVSRQHKHKKTKKKRFKKLCLRLIFFSSIPGGDYWAVERERERERESDCDVVVTSRSIRDA